MARIATRKKDLAACAKLVRRLNDLAAGPDRDFEGRLLTLGCELFGLDVGVIARVRKDRWEIRTAVHPVGMELDTGDSRPLVETFCARVIADEGPIAIRSAKAEGLVDHPMRRDLQLNSYLGIPLEVSGKVIGTLSFAGLRARRHDVSNAELDQLRLLANWLGVELARRCAERALGETRDQLNRLAIQDPVTGVLNRRAVLENLSDERSRASRQGGSVGVFLVNIDRLRELNSNFGHHVGDGVLRDVAERVAGTLRAYDHLGRFGGGEFLSVLPGCNIQQAAEIAERAREALDGAPFDAGGTTVTVTGSFGVSSTDDPKVTDDALLGFADKAMYLAKQRGRNVVRAAAPTAAPAAMEA